MDWSGLARTSALYLGTMHGFRFATEPSTREALQNSFFWGYGRSLGAMHGWSDGDGNYENYLGHPIQGAVSGYIWINHDPKYRVVQFGANRDYWMSRLRAYGYAFAFSEQFEVGLFSEASLGQIQRYCCAYGFVDHVITPNMGMLWLVGGDILDRYVVRKIEDRSHNTGIRILARVALNPPLGFANVLSFKRPWQRENRPGVREYNGHLYYVAEHPRQIKAAELPLVPKFELIASLPSITRYGNRTCYGGQGIAGFRLSPQWQWTMEVGGCTLGNSMAQGWGGDSLTFMTGPQWILHGQSRWTPHFHLRFGGQKITESFCLKYAPNPWGLHDAPPCASDPSGYAQHYETTGPSFSTGGGVDLRLNRALALRMANLDYIHSWMSDLNGTSFNDGFRFSFGVGLRVGTW